MSTLLALPDEVLLQIALQVQSDSSRREPLVNLSLVNRRFQHIVFPLLFSRIALAGDIRDKLIRLINTPTIHSHIRRLLITVDVHYLPISDGWDLAMQMLHSNVPSLTDLNIAMWPHSTAPQPGMPSTYLTFPSLSKLRRVFLDIPFEYPSHEPLSTLQLNDITWIIHGTHNVLPLRYMLSGQSSSTLRQLTIISVDIALNHDIVEINDLLEDHILFPSMAHLTLIKLKMPDGWLGSFTIRAPSLRLLHIFGHGPILLDHNGISQLLELRVLGLCASSMRSEDRFWERATRLESIDLSGKTSEHHIHHDELIQILRGLHTHGSRYLRRLDVDIEIVEPTSGTFISLKDLALLADTAPHLTFLRLTACQWCPIASKRLFCWVGSIEEISSTLSPLMELETLVWDPLITILDPPPPIDHSTEIDMQDDSESIIDEDEEDSDSGHPTEMSLSQRNPALRKLGITEEVEKWEIRNALCFEDASDLLAKSCRALKQVDWILNDDMYYSGFWRWKINRRGGNIDITTEGIDYKELHDGDDD